VVLLQPFRAFFDSDRDPSVRPSFSGVLDTMKIVLSTPRLRDLAFAAFAFGGLQSVYAGFFILYLVDGLEYSEIDAGMIFAIASFTAVIARIAWGWLGSTLVSPRVVMGLIGFLGFVAAVLMGNFDFGWSYGLITAVAILYNVSGLSWHGVLLAETARLAPPDKVGGVTGGVLAFTSVAMMTYPAVYGGMLAITGSYGLGFFFAAIPSFAAGFVFFRPPVEGKWLGLIRNAVIWGLTPARMFYAVSATVIGAVIGATLVYGGLLV